jgi:uncharacterized protein (TIGR03083 family)
MSEPLISILQTTWDDIAALCEGLGDEQWEAATECPGWSVKDQVAHMIGTENMLRGVQPPAADDSAGDAPHVRNDIGKFNEQWVGVYRSRSGAETLADFRAVTAQRVLELEKLTPEEWDKEGFTPEGPGPYRQFMAIRVFDCWYHDQDIREAVGQPGFLEGEPADLSLERIVNKALPYVVGKKASTPPGATVVFDIQGKRPLVAAVGVPPEGRAALLADVPRDATTRIGLDRRTFSRLAGGRWSGEHARREGSVKVTGDQELGGRVVDNLAFTI